MSLLFKNLAKYVAKIIILTATIFLLFGAVSGQKRHTANAKLKKNTTKSHKVVKPRYKPRQKKRPKFEPIVPSLKSMPIPTPVHRELHYTEESWTDAIASKFIIVPSRPNGGILLYRVMHDTVEQNFSIKVDEETAYLVPLKQKNGDLEGCFMMVYCKVHDTALIFSQVQCF